MKKRLIDAWLGFRGIVTVEQVHEALTIRDAANREANAIAQMLHQQDEKLYLISQEMDAKRRQQMLAAVIEGVEARRVKESNRIASMLIPELERTYGRDAEQIETARELRGEKAKLLGRRV